MSNELTHDEADLAAAIEDARPFGENRRTAAIVRGAILRRMLLGLPVVARPGAPPSVVALHSAGIRLKGVRIGGELDLQDLSGRDGGPLPPLVFERCRIPGRIHLSRSRFRHLSFSGSRLSHLCGRNLVVDGPVDLRGVASAEEAERTGERGLGVCWIELPGLHARGAFDIGDAWLIAPAGGEDFALDLTGAVIEGHVHMLPPGSALGGVSVAGSDVHGDVRFDGALLTGAGRKAFAAETARIRGFASLGADRGDKGFARFRAEGQVDFTGAQIGDALQLTGARVENSGKVALRAFNLHIGGPFLMGPDEDAGATIIGQVCLDGVEIGGELDLRAAQFSGAIFAMSAANLKVGGNANLQSLEAQGPLAFPHARINGEFDMTGAVLKPQRPDPESKSDVPLLALDLSNAQIAGAARLNLQSTGTLYLFGLSVGRDLDLRNARIEPRLGDAVIAFDSSVGAELMIVKSKFQGPLLFNDATIADSLNVNDATFASSPSGGGLNADGAKIGGNVRISGVRIAPSASEAPFINALSLNNANVGRALSVAEFDIADAEGGAPYTGRALVDLRDLNVDQLADVGGHGWGDRLLLLLDGLVYDRFAFADDDLPVAQRRMAEWRGRQRWLSLQYAPEEPIEAYYRPQPYDQVVSAFRKSGRFADARRIGKIRLDIERRRSTNLLSPLNQLYGWLFEYGLSPVRAVLTLAAFLALGAFAVIAAQSQLSWNGHSLQLAQRRPAVLVINTSNVAAVVAPKGGAGEFEPAAVVAAPPSSYAGELPCGDEIDPVLYAVEAGVPAVNLNQQTRCTVSTRPAAFIWRVGKAIYTLAGWIITSLTILTVSGILRRNAER